VQYNIGLRQTDRKSNKQQYIPYTTTIYNNTRLTTFFQDNHNIPIISAWFILLVPAYPGCPGKKAVNACTEKDIITLESVQRQFTGRLPGSKAVTYSKRLAKLELESLELRRICAYLLFTYKLAFGITDLKLSDFFISNFHQFSCCHQYQLYLLPCKKAFDLIVIRIVFSMSGITCHRMTLILVLLTNLRVQWNLNTYCSTVKFVWVTHWFYIFVRVHLYSVFS